MFLKSSENSFETPKGCLSCSIRLGNHFYPTGKNFFFRKMSHSAENPRQSSILAKRFVSSKRRGDFDKNKLEKSRMVPKKPNSDTVCWFRENQILKQKIVILKNLTMPKNVKGGPFWSF